MKSKRTSVSPLVALLLAATAVAEAQSHADSALAEGVASLAGDVARAQREAAGPDGPVTMPPAELVARKAPPELPALSGSLEDGAGASVKLPTPEEAKEAAKAAADEADQAKDAAEKALGEAREKRGAAEAAYKEAREGVREAKRALSDAESAAADAMDASQDDPTASAEAVLALENAKKALAEAEDNLAAAGSAVQEAEGAVDAAEDALEEAKDAARAAHRAVRTAESDAVAAAKEAARRGLADAERNLDAARAAQDAAERVYLFAEAVENQAADEKAAAEAAAEAAGALADAEAAVNAANAKVDATGEALDEAGRALAAADRALRDAREAVEDADEATAEEAAAAAKAAADAAATARAAYDEADRAFADARAAAADAAAGLADARRDAEAKADAARSVQDRIDALRRAAGFEPGAESPTLRSAEAEMDAADEDFYQARNAYNAARAEYDKQFPNRHVSHVADMTAPEANADADAVLAPYQDARNITFVGDRLWLAGTEVDGRPLADSFRRGGGLADAIADARARAINGGFYLAGFQDIGDGKVLVDKGRIRSVTARFVDADGNEVTNATFFSEGQILRRFAAGRAATAISNDAENGSLFDFSSVGARFQALNGHPDVKKADIVFTPAPSDWSYVCDDGVTTNKARGVDMEVTVYENPGVLGGMHGVLGVDNYGSMRGSDQWMARGTVQWLNLWQADNAFTLNANASFGGSLWGLAGSYFVPRRGLDRWYDISWTLHGGYTHVNEDDVVPTIDVEGEGWFTGLQASHRLADSGRSTVDLSLGLTYRYVDSALVLQGKKYRMGRNGDGYEILPLSLALIYTDSAIDSWGGRNYATLEGVYNVGVSDADDLKWYRTAIDDENYALLRAQLARIQLLGDFDARDASGLWMLFAKFDSQWATDPVVGAEQFGVGGHSSVRGYEEREFMGDSGFTGTLELRTPILVGLFDHYLGLNLRSEGDSTNGFGWDRLQFVGFVDFGWYQLKEALANGEDDDRFLSGAGLGLRMAASESATLSFDWGFPLVHKKEFDSSSSGTGHVALQFQF